MMIYRAASIVIFILLIKNAPAHAFEQGFCLSPAEPYAEEIDKKLEPELYEFNRQEFQRYFEEMEKFLLCLESTRKENIVRMKEYYSIFKQRYGDDAVFIYDPNPLN